jgi:hypothetical protein
MYKEAYARGVCRALHDVGLVKFANEELAAAAADQAAGGMPEEPIGAVPPETTAELAADLIDLSNQLESAAEQAAETATTASAVVAEKSAELRLRKLREKFSGMGSANDPDDSGQNNTMDNAATVTPEMQLENRARPVEYANKGEDGVGDQDASGKGGVGHEEERDDQDQKQVDKDNSATEATAKAASLSRILRKIASGGAVDENDPSQRNTPEQAAAVTPEMQRENAERPTEYAHSGAGKSVQTAKERAAAIGSEGAHPKQSPVKEPAANSPQEHIPGDKVAEFEEYKAAFSKVAMQYARLLPDTFGDGEKVATIQYMLAQAPDARAAIAEKLAAGEVPEGLKEYVAKAKENGEDDENGEKKEKKEEKKENGEEKDASVESLLSNLRQLARK